jgi:hypothetical protein
MRIEENKKWEWRKFECIKMKGGKNGRKMEQEQKRRGGPHDPIQMLVTGQIFRLLM